MKAVFALGLIPVEVFACQACQPSVYASVLNSEFFGTLGLLLLPLIVTLGIGLMVYSNAEDGGPR